ncbi:MAG: GNAT family N-acetyltransferase [Cellulosilyticaceae bacterium]
MVTIRKMAAHEANQVRKIARSAFDGIEKLFVGRPKEAMVAVMDGQIVGGILIKYMESGDQKVGYIDIAFVHPKYQGQGIGRILYRETVTYLWEQGCTSLSGIVKDDNVGSWQLFLDNGFKRISIREGVGQLGFKGMCMQYIKTPLWMSNGMAFYLATKEGTVNQKEPQTVSQIALYLAANLIMMLLVGWQVGDGLGFYIGAYGTVLVLHVLMGYIGTLFSKRQWHFRLNSGGAALVALISAIGGLYPMIGNWYPKHYESSKAFQKDMGVVALWGWIGMICMTTVASFLQPYHLFWEDLNTFGIVFLLYKMIPVYPLEGYGGRRVYTWHKGIHILLSVLSVVIVLLSTTMK